MLIKITSFAALAAASLFAIITPGTSSTTLYGLTDQSRLVTFDSMDPGFVTASVDITGLQPGESLVGIDMRPANKVLYGVGSTSRIYTIDIATGVATAVGAGPFTPALSGTIFGVDFNPQADRLRVVSNSGQNLRLNPITGAVVLADQPLKFATTPPDVSAGITPHVTAAAYINNVAGATSTLLFDIDTATNALVKQVPPNDGILTTVAPLPLINLGTAGFDVDTEGRAFLALKHRTLGSEFLQVAVVLHEIDLNTGALTTLGTVTARGVFDVAAQL